MAEPENKDSVEWRDWYIRHNFGGQLAEMIKITAKQGGIKNLNILIKFINDIISGKNRL